MLLCTLVLKPIGLCKLNTVKDTENHHQTIPDSPKFCCQSGLQEIKKRGYIYVPTTTALAAHQVQNCVQVINNSLQCCLLKGSSLSQRKIKMKVLSQNQQTIDINWHNSGYPIKQEKSFADRGFSYAAAKYWNDIPDNIRTAKDIKNFKSLLKTHFFKQAFQQ